MKIENTKTGVIFHAYTRQTGEKTIGGFVDRIDCKTGQRVSISKIELSHYGVGIVRTRSLAYRTACKMAKDRAEGHAFIN